MLFPPIKELLAKYHLEGLESQIDSRKPIGPNPALGKQQR